jgi:hypothetical protein
MESRVAAADKGASSPWLPGTIQSSTIALCGGTGVAGSPQQASQSALMKRSTSAVGLAMPSLVQWPCAKAAEPIAIDKPSPMQKVTTVRLAAASFEGGSTG